VGERPALDQLEHDQGRGKYPRGRERPQQWGERTKGRTRLHGESMFANRSASPSLRLVTVLEPTTDAELREEEGERGEGCDGEGCLCLH
jgi:hypothetical protein